MTAFRNAILLEPKVELVQAISRAIHWWQDGRREEDVLWKIIELNGAPADL